MKTVEVQMSDLLMIEKIIKSCAFTYRKKFRNSDGSTRFADTVEIIKQVKDERLPSAEELLAITKMIDSYVEAGK